MTRLSPAAVLAWKIAMIEALQAGSPALEREHLLIGLFSLEKALSLKDFIRDAGTARRVLDEKDALDFPLRNSDADAAIVRRRVRQALPRGEQERRDRIVHRSPECRRYFDRASALANGKEVTCVHLFQAIMEDPGRKILGIVDQVSPAERRPAGLSATMQMTMALRKFEDTQERRQHLHADITCSRSTLASVPKNSAQYRQLQRDLAAKSLRLALLCLEIRDIAGLVRVLRELAPAAAGGHQPCRKILAELEYMQEEEIPLLKRSSGIIRSILEDEYRKAGGGVPA